VAEHAGGVGLACLYGTGVEVHTRAERGAAANTVRYGGDQPARVSMPLGKELLGKHSWDSTKLSPATRGLLSAIVLMIITTAVGTSP
jgi:hypothetical protein